MSGAVLITKYGTHFNFAMNRKYIVNSGDSIYAFLYRYMSFSYDKQQLRWFCTTTYFHFDDHQEEVSFPIYVLPLFIEFLNSKNIAYLVSTLQPDEWADIDIKVNPSWIARDEQIGAIDYLSRLEEDIPIKGIALQPGKGKTFCIIKTITLLKRRTIIYVDGLIDQWKKALLEQTNLRPKDIYILTGMKSIRDLATRIKRIKPKIIIASVRTMQQYAKAAPASLPLGVPSFDSFHALMQVGVRVVDECHLNFTANLTVDLRSNIAYTIVASATFSRTGEVENRVFGETYIKDIRYGESDYTTYVQIFDVGYNLPEVVSPFQFKTAHGYNHGRYEKYLLNRKYRFNYMVDKVWFPMIYGHFLNVRLPGQKLLILVSLIDTATALAEALLLRTDDLKIAVYAGDEKDESQLVGYDIIISTPKSAGTGRDIKNLRTVLLTVAVNSPPLNEQILGRLRELTESVPIFAYFSDKGNPTHRNYREARQKLFREKALIFNIVNVY